MLTRSFQVVYRFTLNFAHVKNIAIILLLFCTVISAFCQTKKVTLSGIVKDQSSKQPLPYVNVILTTESDSVFVVGTVTTEAGQFTLTGVAPGTYVLSATYIGFEEYKQPVLVGRLSEFLDLGE